MIQRHEAICNSISARSYSGTPALASRHLALVDLSTSGPPALQKIDKG